LGQAVLYSKPQGVAAVELQQAVLVVHLLVVLVVLPRLGHQQVQILVLAVEVQQLLAALVLVVLAGLELFIFAAVLKVMLLLQPKVMVLLQVVQDQPQLRIAVFHTTFLLLQVTEL
jgi:hypothetical protein